MQANIKLIRDKQSGKLKLETSGTKWVLFTGLLFFSLLLYVLGLSCYRGFVSIKPYKGTVQTIQADWLSAWFGAEGSMMRRVVIQTPEGARITRFIRAKVMVWNLIEKGDMIEKKEGIFSQPKPIDKKTLREYKKLLKEQ
ncbi:MAG: hypothetical protein U5R06_19985 [candidate division KSB1 bacterium]|nr:hypothetical protein [candidate division KSB1 bacterium]